MKKSLKKLFTQDGEVNDMNSVIRALLYSNEMDIAGIILTSSVFHYAGDKEKNLNSMISFLKEIRRYFCIL